MNDFLSYILQKIDGDPTRIGEAFEARLTYQEELMLGKLDEELGMCVEKILDAALASATAANNGEISMDFHTRTRVMELTAARKAIHALLTERGTMRHCRNGVN
jgi:hypothetical protein